MLLQALKNESCPWIYWAVLGKVCAHRPTVFETHFDFFELNTISFHQNLCQGPGAINFWCVSSPSFTFPQLGLICLLPKLSTTSLTIFAPSSDLATGLSFCRNLHLAQYLLRLYVAISKNLTSHRTTCHYLVYGS